MPWDGRILWLAVGKHQFPYRELVLFYRVCAAWPLFYGGRARMEAGEDLCWVLSKSGHLRIAAFERNPVFYYGQTVLANLCDKEITL